METKNDIEALREILFDTIRQLKDKDNPMELDRAKAISDVAQNLINSAKVEVDYAKVTGTRTSTNFLPQQNNLTGGYTHRLGDRSR